MKAIEELQAELKIATGEYNCAIANGLVLKSRPWGRIIKKLERQIAEKK